MGPIRMREYQLPSKRGATRTPPLQQQQKGGIQRRPLIARSARRSMMATSAQVDVLQKVRRILDKGKATESLNNPVAVKRLDSKLSVVVRVRPLNPREMTASAREIVLPVTRQVLLFDPPRPANTTYFKNRPLRDHGNSNAKPKNATYGFDRVYFNQDTNEDIYNEVMKPLVGTLLQGYNCSVFAYGSTGSGKTFTMLGGKDSPGLTLLTLRDLYQQLDAAQDDYQSDVIVSYLEVYNEQISDLLNKSSGSLQIRDAGRGNEAVIVNLSEHRPPNVESLLQLLQAGNGNRTQHATDLNAESSRSHAVLQVHISMRDKHTSMETVSRKAKLVMVDLAGSEKGSATGFTGERFREGTNINKSLLSLANCISALSGGKACASFRDSKLTRILKDSLSGNCRTVMVANVSPADTMKEDTLNTLKYASQAKKITLQASQNTMTVQTCLSNFTRVVEEMAEKIEHLQDEQKTKDDLLESQKLELVAKDELIESQKQELEDKDLELRLLQEKVKAQKLKLMKLYQRKQRKSDTKEVVQPTPSADEPLVVGENEESDQSDDEDDDSEESTSENEFTKDSASDGSDSTDIHILPTLKLSSYSNMNKKLLDYKLHLTKLTNRLIANFVNLKRMLQDVELKASRCDTLTSLHKQTGDERFQLAAEKITNKINSMQSLMQMYKGKVRDLEKGAINLSLSRQYWDANVASSDQMFQITSEQLRSLKQTEVASAIKYEQSVKGFLWLQNKAMKKLESNEEMLKNAFLVLNELKNYLRYKDLDVNEASPRFKKFFDSFCGSPSVRFSIANTADEAELFDEEFLDEELEEMFSLTEMEFLCGMTDPKNEDIKEEDELHDVNVIDLETSDDEVEYIETVITKGTPVPCKVKASGSQSNSPTLDGNPLHDDGFEEEDDKTDGIQKVQSEGSSKSVPSNGEEEQVELELPVKVVATCSKTLTASAAASADPIKFYGLDETRGEAEMIEAQSETEDQEMTECDRNRTVCISTTEASITDLRSESTAVQLTFPPPSTSYNPPPLSQVLKPNTNTNADITFVYPVESGNEGPSSNNNLQSTFVKEAGDTVENLIPSSTSANLPCIGELVEKISNNAGATIPPKKDMKSAILSRGKPEAPVSQLKKGVPNCSPPKRFRTGGFQTPATSGSTQKPSYSSGSIPAPRMSWKKTPHAHVPVSKNLPPKKASGSFGPPKPTN